MAEARAQGARRETRYPLNCAVQLSWRTPSGGMGTMRGDCQDVSSHGARIQANQPLEARSSVYLQASALGLMGNATVRYCRRRGVKYDIGLEFTWASQLAEAGRKKAASSVKT